MAKAGSIPLTDLVVKRVIHDKAGTSTLLIAKGPYTITIEKSGAFPDDFNPRPDGLVDLKLDYDPK